jgi:hypothetical protein
LLGIEALGKAPGIQCAHCAPPNGCTIYASRPGECREFSCLWLETPQMPEEWKPTRSRIVLYLIDDGSRMIAHVDPRFPRAWQQQPYYDQLKAWARRWARSGPRVVVRVDTQLIAILPDEDVDLGHPQKGDAIFIGEVPTPAGPKLVAQRVPAGQVAADGKVSGAR